MKKVRNHPVIKGHRKKMMKDKRCIQCINPWYDGPCGCGKWDDEQNEILKVAAKLLEEGWEG